MKFSLSAVLFSLLLFSLPAQAGKYNHVLNLGDPMPAFSKLPATDGSHLSSTDLREDVVVLVLLANHCPWVRGMDQDLVKVADLFADKSVRFLGFSVNHREDDRLPAMRKHAEKAGYNFSYVFDESQDLGRKLGATRTPEYFVFNKERKLIYMGLLYNSPAKMNKDGSIRHIDGEVDTHYVADAINATLAGEEVTIAETRAHGCSAKYEQ